MMPARGDRTMPSSGAGPFVGLPPPVERTALLRDSGREMVKGPGFGGAYERPEVGGGGGEGDVRVFALAESYGAVGGDGEVEAAVPLGAVGGLLPGQRGQRSCLSEAACDLVDEVA